MRVPFLVCPPNYFTFFFRTVVLAARVPCWCGGVKVTNVAHPTRAHRKNIGSHCNHQPQCQDSVSKGI